MANPPGENALCYSSGGSTQDGRPAIALPAAARRHVQHSAVGFRGAILSLGPPQSALLSIYLWRPRSRGAQRHRTLLDTLLAALAVRELHGALASQL
jgi:hypothetical protein